MVTISTNPIATTSSINRDGTDLNTEGAQTSPLGPVSAPAATKDRGKRKRAEREVVKPRKKQKKHRNASDEQLSAEDEDEDEDEDDAESSGGEELTSDEDKQHIRSSKSTKGTTMDPSHFIGDNETDVESPVIDTGHLPSIKLPELAAVDRDVAHMPIIQESTSIARVAPPSTVPPPLMIEGLQSPLAVTLPPMDVKWPTWFGKVHTVGIW